MLQRVSSIFLFSILAARASDTETHLCATRALTTRISASEMTHAISDVIKLRRR